jgi:hypothetical protein
LFACLLAGQARSQEDLPDDYIPFTLYRLDDGLEGSSQFLEGFEITMDIPRHLLRDSLNADAILSLVRDRNIKGTLTYPNGRTTPIEYEVVLHRGTEEIYMKSSLGYFLWEYVILKDGQLNFAIYWWYHPPAAQVDLRILEMVEKLLGDPKKWHQDDDRDCSDDIESAKWSLFCALKHSSIEMTGEYNHHNTAMQTVRSVIRDMHPDHQFEHVLMDYNNASTTTHNDIMHVVGISMKRIKLELSKSTTNGNHSKF